MPPEPAGAKVLRSDSSDSRQAKSPATQDALEIILPGFLTTVQDRGRYGYQRFGVPVSGAMDDFALRAANILAGNDEGAAGLEISVLGPRIRVLYDTWIAVTGADLSPTIDGETIPRWETVRVSKGSVLSFAGVRDGMRAYLAIAGGIDVPLVMSSRSTYLKGAIGGYEGRALRAGDVLEALSPKPGSRRVERRFPRDHIPSYGHEHNLRVIMGSQDHYFNDGGISTFLSSRYVVSDQSDRTGYILEGPAIQHKSGPDIVSDGSPLGAIQVPGDGRPIILLADRGTTGGYAKIGTVISSDISKLAQAMPGDAVTFKKVTVEEAYSILRRQESLLKSVAQTGIGGNL
ncbi:MAG: biotin-dependent carboxyltransferase [Chloroflexi bacterium]|nr:biotin-dependent carboxyltransferase [Chloroflexota bacterium]